MDLLPSQPGTEPAAQTPTEAARSLDLRDLGHEELTELMVRLGEKRFRGEQIFRWVHARSAGSLEEMTDVSKALRARLASEEGAHVAQLDIDLAQVSIDGTRKLRLRTRDNRLIESVLIPDDDARLIGADGAAAERDDGAADDDDDDEAAPQGEGERRKLTQCVSSQVGCAIDCDFCATAKLGFGRNLSAGEIVSQIYQAERLLSGLPATDPTIRAGGTRITNVVFMGMGEPLHNYDNVTRALRILLHPLGRGLSRRRITVSTSGLVPAIDRLAREGFPVNLAVSLNASTDEQRDRVMPINKKYPLRALCDALRRFPLEKRQRITIEYVLLKGVNDSLDDARRLPELLRGIPCKLNVIPWNPHPQAPYERPELGRVLAFQRECMRLGFAVYIRKTRGVDIDAACGQLAAENDPRAGRAVRRGRGLPVVTGP
jgi:23S rRNA (adenine2503-C2)-methyltransferase